MGEVNRDTIKALIEYVATSLVDDAKAVKVKHAEKESYTVLELSVDAGDLGKVIGKNGRTAQAMRTLLGLSRSETDRDLVLDILD